MQAQAQAKVPGLPYLLDSIDEFARLPEDVKGWVFPAHQDDTCIVATRSKAEVTFGALRHPVTGEAISYRTNTESAVGFTPPWAKQPQSAV